MTTHTTGTRDQWLAARLELLEAEKEHTRRSDELARRRQELPWVPVEKEYRFETAAGPASLRDLFGGRSQLLVYHFMFGPDFTAGCPSCSAIADGFNGSVVHLRIALSRRDRARLRRRDEPDDGDAQRNEPQVRPPRLEALRHVFSPRSDRPRENATPLGRERQQSAFLQERGCGL